MASAGSTENESFIQDVLECFWYTVSREDLQHLVTEDEAWEMVRAEAGLGRAEADELHEALKGLAADMPEVDKKKQQEDQQARKRFMELFPQLETKFKHDVRKL